MMGYSVRDAIEHMSILILQEVTKRRHPINDVAMSASLNASIHFTIVSQNVNRGRILCDHTDRQTANLLDPSRCSLWVVSGFNQLETHAIYRIRFPLEGVARFFQQREEPKG